MSISPLFAGVNFDHLVKALFGGLHYVVTVMMFSLETKKQCVGRCFKTMLLINIST